MEVITMAIISDYESNSMGESKKIARDGIISEKARADK